MLTCSKYRVTINATTTAPIVILDYDEEIEDELVLSQSRLAELVTSVRGSYARGLPRLNKAHRIGFERLVEHSDVIASREALFERPESIPDTIEDLLVEIEGGKGFQFLDVIVEEIPNALSNATETSEVWEFSAGRMIQLATGGIAALKILDSASADVLDSNNDPIYGTQTI